MFSQSVLTLLALALSVNGLTVPQEYQGDGFLSFPLGKRDNAGNYEALLDGQHNSPFYIPLTVGTPPVHYNGMMDTGSYDFIVPNYNYNDSTTVQYNYEGTGWGRPVSWVHDIVSYGSAPGVLNGYGIYQDQKPNSGGVGIIGSHFLHGEFPSYFQTLKDQGYTQSASFSFWYDTYSNAKKANASFDGDHSGYALFGAYDAAKYQGPLVTLNLTTADQGSWNVFSDGIVTPDGSVHYAGQAASFDTGNNNIVLPQDTIQAIQASLNGSTWHDNGAFISYPTCDFTDDQKLVFKFQDAEINVNLRDISYPYAGVCALYFQVGPPTFGVPLVANSFTVFDIDNKTVSIADRKFTVESDVQLWLDPQA